MKKLFKYAILLAAVLLAAACTREMKVAKAADNGKIALEG